MSIERTAGKISAGRNKNKPIQPVKPDSSKKKASRPVAGIEDANRT